MNNLHRELAPISTEAWEQIDQEATRTLKRHLAGRKVVDVPPARGLELAAVDTGHQSEIKAPGEGILAARREVKALVELRVPFELSRRAIDDVARGSQDSNWDPLKAAARKIAFAEDRAIFDGYGAAGIEGIRPSSSNATLSLPPNVDAYPESVARAVAELRLAGVQGPYALVLGADAYQAASGGSDDGYPVLHHLKHVVDGGIVWAPAIDGGLVLTTRGGDYELNVGQDFSIGYTGHSASAVELYFVETFTFRPFTSEASVALKAGMK